MSSNDPVTRILNAELEKLRLELAPEAVALRTALADEERGLRSALAAAVKSGERLSLIRQRVPHRLWLPWLKLEFPLLSDETARRKMRLFKLSKSHNLWDLAIPISAFYLLAEESTPSAARNEIMRRADSGEAFSFDDIATIIAQAKNFLLVETVEDEPIRISVPYYPSKPEAAETGEAPASNIVRVVGNDAPAKVASQTVRLSEYAKEPTVARTWTSDDLRQVGIPDGVRMLIEAMRYFGSLVPEDDSRLSADLKAAVDNVRDPVTSKAIQRAIVIVAGLRPKLH
jgi:hypothetical protein